MKRFWRSNCCQRWVKGICGFLIVSIGWTCNEDNPRVGGQLISSQLQFKTDSVHPTLYNVSPSDFRSDNLPRYLAGEMRSDTFGHSEAVIYSQILLPSSDIDLGENLWLDSVVLYLDYQGFYGESDQPQTLRVFELTEQMKQRAYYTDRSFQYQTPSIGKARVVPSQVDNKIAIRLAQGTGKKLLQQSGTSTFSNSEALTQFFKGLRIAGTDQNSGIFYLDISSDVTRLTLYYQSESSDTGTFSFEMENRDGVVVNEFQHDYDGTPAEQHIANPDSSKGESVIYLQSMNGARGRIKLPDLQDQYTESAINKAELHLPALSSGSSFPLSQELMLARLDTNVAKIAQLQSGANEKFYKFDITNYMQGLLDGSIENKGFYVYSFPRAQTAARVVISGGRHTTKKTRLRLFYTPITQN